MYHAATRSWLQVKFMPADTRGELVTQAMVWMALLLVLIWGVVGLVAAPLS